MKSEAASPTRSSFFERLRRKLSFFSKKADDKDENKGSLSATETISISTSSSSSDDLQKVFNFFDENGDGRITASELQSRLRMVGGELSMAEAEAAVLSSDLNGDGVLDFDGFQRLMEGSRDNEEDKNSEMRDAFALYVMEGSYSITPASLKRMLSRLGESKSIDDCKAMIRPFDLNGDGLLSFEEFAIMMH